MTNSQIKAQVGLFVKQGLTTKEIAGKLGITFNQATHIRNYYFGGTRSKLSPQKRAWETRRANNEAKQVEVAKPRIIELNGLIIEVHASMVSRVIVPSKNLIKIF